MPRWTEHELASYLRKASRAKPEPAVCDDALAADEGKAADPGRCEIRVTSFRRRLCDPDNLAVKYHIDALRYAGIIEDDSPDHIGLSIRQVKVRNKTDEMTLIEIEMP